MLGGIMVAGPLFHACPGPVVMTVRDLELELAESGVGHDCLLTGSVGRLERS
jgi:hypothetical protein